MSRPSPGLLHVVVLAAGEGKRLGTGRPKVLTPLWGRPSLLWVLEACAGLEAQATLVVAGGRAEDEVRGALSGRPATSVVRQEQPLGTGHAVLAAAPVLAGVEGDLLVLYGDGPLVTPALLSALLAAHRQGGADLTLTTVELDQPAGYGRILRDARGGLAGIVEERDASDAQRLIREVNAGIWVFRLPQGLARLATVGRANQAGEIYLTDLLAATLADGGRVGALPWPRPQDLLGFNDQVELAQVRGLLRQRILAGLLASGVEIVDPASTWVDAEASIAPGARILPCTVIEGDVRVAAGCEVGPFARLRHGTVLEAGAKVGNFTETKQARLGPGVKAGHLSYLGDVEIGAGTNIGAGTITANYDGREKHRTVIGARAFIGSGTVIVAPGSVGDEATTGAGAVLTKSSAVEAGSTWVGVPARPLPRAGSAPRRTGKAT